MQRLLPALAAFALVVAGVGGGILLLASRDHSGIRSETAAATPSQASTPGPFGLPRGNVVVTYSEQSDRSAIDRLAAALGAIDTKAARAAGQALVSKGQPGPITATASAATIQVPSTSDPRLAAFVRQYLGRIAP